MNHQDQSFQPSEFKHIDNLSDLLDSKFRIPGTNIRFGIDSIVGLVPYAGDVVTFAFSGLLLVTMAKYGASGIVVTKMLWNILLDTVVGSVPVIGDIFDFQFKANRRNYYLLREHYQEGKHSGSAWPVIFLLVIVLILSAVFIVFVSWRIMQWIFS
jgi:hypothetical protein